MASISVENNVVTITVNGGVQPLTPSPAGTFNFATITVDQFGRITSASQNNDVASAATQAQILVTVDYISQQLDGGLDGGLWDNTP